MRKKLFLLLLPFSISVSFSIPFPFVPFSGVQQSNVVATALISSVSTLVGLRYLINFKKKSPVEIPKKKEISIDFFYPIKYEIKLYESFELKLKKVNWKVVGNKALEVWDWIDMGIGWIPVFGDVFDIIDSGLHIAYDYAYDRENLKWDLVFIAGAFIPGASAGAERVIARRFISKLVKVGIESKDAREIWKIGKKYLHGRQMREDLINFFRTEGAKSLIEKNKKYATQVAIGYSFVLKEIRSEGKKIVDAPTLRKEIINLAENKRLEKFVDRGLHRVIFQHESFGIEIKTFERIEKKYGKFTKGVLLFRADKISLYEKKGLIDKVVLKDLVDDRFERFTLINVNDLSDVEKIKNMIRYIRISLEGIERAEKRFTIESEYTHINFEYVVEGEVGHYKPSGEVSFSLKYIIDEEQEEYVVRHELMHGIGSKLVKGETLDYLYKKYYKEYYVRHIGEANVDRSAEEFASHAVNEYMDLLNVKLWKEVGYKRYYEMHINSFKWWNRIDLHSEEGIIDIAELSALGVKMKVPNEFRDIYNVLLGDYKGVLR